MPLYLKPHSPEWFSALEQFNPHQATATKKILELAGRSDVCSICGDEPTIDYKLAGEKLPKDAVATLRLCDGCHQIRSNTYGESFIPLAN